MPLKVGDVVRLSTKALGGLTRADDHPTGIGVIIEDNPTISPEGYYEPTYNVEFRYRTPRTGRNWYFEDELEKLSTREAAMVLAEHVLGDGP